MLRFFRLPLDSTRSPPLLLFHHGHNMLLPLRQHGHGSWLAVFAHVAFPRKQIENHGYIELGTFTGDWGELRGRGGREQ
jgi:hypothetical protein